MLDKLKSRIAYYDQEMKKIEVNMANFHFLRGAKEEAEALLKMEMEDLPQSEAKVTDCPQEPTAEASEVVVE